MQWGGGGGGGEKICLVNWPCMQGKWCNPSSVVGVFISLISSKTTIGSTLTSFLSTM